MKNFTNLQPTVTENYVKLLPAKPNTVIASIGFDNEGQKLIIKFQTGRVYQYYSSLMCDFINLVESPQPGVDFNLYIKDNYQYAEVDGIVYTKNNFEYVLPD